ncbi:MAG: NIL domain-containing protein [Dehalococcoidia bacterium]
MNVTKRVVLHFPEKLVDQHIMCRLAKEFGIDFNILKASVTPREEGLLVIELSGTEDGYQKASDYLIQTGVAVQPLSQDIVRDENSCTHCGACPVLCPTGALTVTRDSMKVVFDDSRCIACGVCINACPVRAMKIRF